MKKIFYIGFVLLLLSCTNQANIDSLSNDLSAELDLCVNIKGNESKGAILNNILPTGSTIGISVFDESNETYAGLSYENFPYKCNGNVLEPVNDKIMLNLTEGVVYGYYPYVEDADIECLPISVATQQDYMWATPITNISYLNSSAALSLNHTMALLKLDIVKGNYTGEGQVTDVHVKGSNIFLYANYNGKTGEILERANVNQPVSAEGEEFLLGTSSINRNIILIPVLNSADATLSIVIDGIERRVTIPSFQPIGGKSFSYVLTVNDKELVLSNVNVDLWEETNNVYNVSITGNTNNIAINKEVKDDGTIVITAMPMVYGESVKEVLCNGSSLVSSILNSSTGSRIITLSSITSDVSVKFDGLTSTGIVYYVESETTELRILGSGLDLRNIKAVAVDGLNVEISSVITVSEPGIHEVRVWLADGVISIPTLFCGTWTGRLVSGGEILKCYGPNIVGDIFIPDYIRSIGLAAFSGCGFDSITTQASFYTIGEDAFENCINLSHFDFSLIKNEIGNCAFAGCVNLSGVCSLSSGLKTLGYGFLMDTNISKIYIPDSVTSYPQAMGTMIGGAKGCELYIGKGLSSYDMLDDILDDSAGTHYGLVSLPDNITEIPIFWGRRNNDTELVLHTIICAAKTAPELDYPSLYNYSVPSDHIITLKVLKGSQGYDSWKCFYLNSTSTQPGLGPNSIIEYVNNF